MCVRTSFDRNIYFIYNLKVFLKKYLVWRKILTFYQAGEKRDIGRLSPSRRQTHPNLVQLVPQHFAPVLGLRPSEDATQKGGVEALWWGQPPLHLRNGDLVLGGGGQEGEAARGRAEDVSGEDGGEAVVLVLLAAVAGVPEAGRGADDGGEEAAHLLLHLRFLNINAADYSGEFHTTFGLDSRS
jgi:hypothetical protein